MSMMMSMMRSTKLDGDATFADIQKPFERRGSNADSISGCGIGGNALLRGVLVYLYTVTFATAIKVLPSLG